MFQFQPEGHVVEHTQVGKQGVALEYHRRVAFVGRQIVDPFAVDQDIAYRRRLKAGDHPQDRGFAATGRAEQRDEFSGFDLQRYIVDRFEGARFVRGDKLLGDVLEFDRGHFAHVSVLLMTARFF